MVTRTWARALSALGAGMLAVAACQSEHYIDLTKFCDERPSDSECVGRAGTGGGSGDAGGGTGGSPEMGAAGV
nr:hypothetical protein [Polyangiaceae bacterium]